MEIINDFDTSVRKAFSEIDEDWEVYDGLVVAGTHDPKDIENTLEKIRLARETNRPFLGICMGLQLMVIEYARNVLGIKDATSEEFGAGTPVVVKMPKLRVGIFNVNGRPESHWHNYKVNGEYVRRFKGYQYSFSDDVLEELFFRNMVGVQYHPEYQSSRDKPHPLLFAFLDQCRQYTKFIPRT